MKDRGDSGVSEIIGFIIVFAILLATISLVYLNAFPQLERTRDAEHVNNAQRAFSVLQDNINDIVVRGDSSRSTEISIRDTSLEVGGLSWVNVSIGGEWSNSTVNPISYGTGGQSVVYENGAVIRVSGDGSSMAFEPDWRVEDDIVVIPVIRTNGKGSFAGSDTVLVRASEGSSLWDANESRTVKVSVNSPRTSAWRNYFEGFEAADDVSVSGDEVTMEVINVDRILYVEYFVEIEMSS